MLYGDMASNFIDNSLQVKSLKMLEQRPDSITLDGKESSHSTTLTHKTVPGLLPVKIYAVATILLRH